MWNYVLKLPRALIFPKITSVLLEMKKKESSSERGFSLNFETVKNNKNSSKKYQI